MRRVLTLCLLSALLGCSSTAKNKTAGGDSLPPREREREREFVGSPSAPERDGTPGNLAARPLGMLAGQVVDGDGRRVAMASIQVIELDGGRGRARLSVSSDRNGYFDIPGLEKGRRYQLVASVDRGGAQHVGKATSVASNVRVAIYLTETRPAGEAAADRGGPPAALGAPVRVPDKAADAPAGIDPTRTATRDKREFDDTPTAPANVPGPGREDGDDPSRKPAIPPPPATPEAGVTTPLPGATPAPAAALSRERETPAARVIPACVVRGQRVQELALYDSHGQPWELSEKHAGKLVLLDFWILKCRPCVAALPKLAEMQAKYGPQGLQVVGVLCDRGTREQRLAAMAELASKTGVALSYPVLFSDEGDCPVRRHLEVHGYPTLVLLDETGKVVWKGVGYTAEGAAELERKVQRLLAERR